MLVSARRSADLTLDDDGAEQFAQALDEAACIRLDAVLAALPTSKPGVRIGDGPQPKPFLDTAGPIGAIARSVLGPEARPVRAILFDKTAERNWALGWHQDRTIVVKDRTDADGFGPWTVKAAVTSLGERVCLAERGDVWLYATSIVHASLAAYRPRRRRVLQIDYSADATPGPLAWRGM